MPIYINTTKSIEELSREQTRIQLERKTKAKNEYMEKNYKARRELTRRWNQMNKDHLANYRQTNRERIRRQYKEYMERQQTT